MTSECSDGTTSIPDALEDWNPGPEYQLISAGSAVLLLSHTARGASTGSALSYVLMLAATKPGFWSTNPLNLVIHLSQVLLKAGGELAQLGGPVFPLNSC